ncbi:MAG: secretin and TonB N-terminal domain-containing protein [Candidatus Omnitrophica bacterium]|nr:secretin and TonB N-terminal domain-containing protein [Candidatus Omnitrophota bacterium]
MNKNNDAKHAEQEKAAAGIATRYWPPWRYKNSKRELSLFIETSRFWNILIVCLLMVTFVSDTFPRFGFAEDAQPETQSPSSATEENKEEKPIVETEQSDQPMESPSASEEISTTEKSASEAAKPTAVTVRKPTSDDPSTADAEGETLVSLDFKDADISEVLSALAKAYGLNIIAGKEIIGKVSISLTDVTLEDALDAILKLNKYSYKRNKTIITIVALSDQVNTEVFRLEFAKANEVKDLFKNMLSEKGDLRVNEQLNEMIITDDGESLEKVRDLLYRVDSPPPQVIIEAKLIDIAPKDLAALGMDWSVNYTNATRKNKKTLLNEIDYNMDAGSAFLGSATTGDVEWEFTTPFFTPENKATFDFLVQENKANVLSAPRIAVLNNQAAKIVIGEKVGIKEQTQTASGTIESVRFVDVGITLKVTPQISGGGYVSMEISTEVSSVKTFLENNLPRITTREASTHVRVKDRQTIVIAGLLKDEYSDSRSQFPFVKNIPFLRNLLGNFGSSREMKELVVFITPNIIKVADRIDPKDRATFKRQQAQLEGYKLKHEELMSRFYKGGMPQAVQLNTEAFYSDDENLFERASWYERAVDSKFKPRKYRDIKMQYLKEAVITYTRFAENSPDDPRTPEALHRTAKIYEKEFGNINAAYETYRWLAMDYPASPYAAEAVKKIKKLEKKIKKEEKEVEDYRSKIYNRLDGLGIQRESKAQEITEVKHA